MKSAAADRGDFEGARRKQVKITREYLSGGTVTYQQTSEIVDFAEKCLIQYFKKFGPKKPGDMEDDFCGKPSTYEIMSNPQGRWRNSPFFPALGRLVDKKIINYRIDEIGDVWYFYQTQNWLKALFCHLTGKP